MEVVKETLVKNELFQIIRETIFFDKQEDKDSNYRLKMVSYQLISVGGRKNFFSSYELEALAQVYAEEQKNED